MKKISILLLLTLFLTACGEKSIPVFSDTEDLAAAIYDRAGIEKNGVYCEEVENDLAFAFGISQGDFDEYVDSALCYRQAVDRKGQTLYLFETESDRDSVTLADKLYQGYEFPPCDAAEKMTVACAGNYVMLFKSNISEVEAAVEGFRSASGGALRFRKDKNNHQ